MSRITARLPDEMIAAIDHAARTLHRSRADIIRKSIEHFLEDFGDLNTALDRLRDSSDEALDWDAAKREQQSSFGGGK